MNDLVIDAGNTRIKIAIYCKSKKYDVRCFPSSDKNACFNFLDTVDYQRAIVSSVLNLDATNELLSHLNSNTLLLQETTTVPIAFDYHSRQTLGKDRLANAVYAHLKAKKNALIIDVGTCIKFDFISAEGMYKGGSISAGLQMRFTAMHEHTGNLPLLNNLTATKLIGNSTVNSMTSGVMNGAKYEIEGMIVAYQKEFKDLVIFATGGDVTKLDLNSSLPLIYDEHLTLNGLYEILQYQQ